MNRPFPIPGHWSKVAVMIVARFFSAWQWWTVLTKFNSVSPSCKIFDVDSLTHPIEGFKPRSRWKFVRMYCTSLSVALWATWPRFDFQLKDSPPSQFCLPWIYPDDEPNSFVEFGCTKVHSQLKIWLTCHAWSTSRHNISHSYHFRQLTFGNILHAESVCQAHQPYRFVSRSFIQRGLS